jgi:hypothetical protein
MSMPHGDARWYPVKRNTAGNGISSIPPPNVVKFAPMFTALRDEVYGASRLDRGEPVGTGRGAFVEDALAYVELERDATRVRSFTIDLVDGLMRTPDYAAAVIRASEPTVPESVVRQRVEDWSSRWARLDGKDALRVEVVVAENALRVRVGGGEVMRRQLRHLAGLAELPNVDLRVVLADSAHPATGAPFSILSFDETYADIGYVELLDKGLYLDDPCDVEPYRARFAWLQEVALDPVRTREFITTIASMLG